MKFIKTKKEIKFNNNHLWLYCLNWNQLLTNLLSKYASSLQYSIFIHTYIRVISDIDSIKCNSIILNWIGWLERYFENGIRIRYFVRKDEKKKNNKNQNEIHNKIDFCNRILEKNYNKKKTTI